MDSRETVLEIRLNATRQIFNTLDPAPFHEKDLDDKAAEYLVQACEEAPRGNKLRLRVHLPAAEAETESARTVPGAINNYFAYRERQLRKDVAKLFRYGAVSLVIGLIFLMACIVLRRELIARGYILDQSIADEGLLILGWVAMWRPMEMLLYDWWPLARRGRLLHRLARIPVEVRAYSQLP